MTISSSRERFRVPSQLLDESWFNNVIENDEYFIDENLCLRFDK
jgi:hypothetical protein